jgi:hypothetical protein
MEGVSLAGPAGPAMSLPSVPFSPGRNQREAAHFTCGLHSLKVGFPRCQGAQKPVFLKCFLCTRDGLMKEYSEGEVVATADGDEEEE